MAGWWGRQCIPHSSWYGEDGSRKPSLDCCNAAAPWCSSRCKESQVRIELAAYKTMIIGMSIGIWENASWVFSEASCLYLASFGWCYSYWKWIDFGAVAKPWGTCWRHCLVSGFLRTYLKHSPSRVFNSHLPSKWPFGNWCIGLLSNFQ